MASKVFFLLWFMTKLLSGVCVSVACLKFLSFKETRLIVNLIKLSEFLRQTLANKLLWKQIKGNEWYDDGSVIFIH